MVIENDDEQAQSLSLSISVPPLISLGAGYDDQSQVTIVTPIYNYGPITSGQSAREDSVVLKCNQAVFLRRLARGNRSLWKRAREKIALFLDSRRSRRAQTASSSSQVSKSGISSSSSSPPITTHGHTQSPAASDSADPDLSERLVSISFVSMSQYFCDILTLPSRASIPLRYCFYTFCRYASQVALTWICFTKKKNFVYGTDRKQCCPSCCLR